MLGYDKIKAMVAKAVTTKGLVVNVQNEKCDVLVGGPNSAWKLPIQLKMALKKEPEHRDKIISEYRIYLERRFKNEPHLKDNLKKQLGGKILGCFCKPQSCHADILADIANS